MTACDPRVDAYIGRAAEFARPILRHLRELVHRACPDCEETLKWGAPSFMYRGKILCSMAAFKQHATFGLWQGGQVGWHVPFASHAWHGGQTIGSHVLLAGSHWLHVGQVSGIQSPFFGSHS